MLLALLLSQLIQPPLDGQGVWLMGRRFPSDYAADVIVSSEHHRPGSYIFGVWQHCDFQTVGVATNGDIHFGQSLTGDCTGNPSGGMLVDISHVSGHMSLTVADRFSLVTGGALGAQKDWTLPDGDVVCGVTPFAVAEPDGGCFLPYAGEHGDHTLSSRFPMPAGFLLQLSNPQYTGRNAYVAEWDYNGGYSQGHGLTRAQFPDPCPHDIYVRAPGAGGQIGTFMYGSRPGVQMWASDTKHWYHAVCGVGWVQGAEQQDLDALAYEIQTLKDRLADAGFP